MGKLGVKIINPFIFLTSLFLASKTTLLLFEGSVGGEVNDFGLFPKKTIFLMAAFLTNCTSGEPTSLS